MGQWAWGAFVIQLGMAANAMAALPQRPSFPIPSQALRRPGDPQYKDVQQFLRRLVAANPSTTRLFTIGTSDTGQPIEGVEIGGGPVRNLVVATHHGNEYGSTEVALAFAAEIARQPIRGQTLYVIPVLNISGYDARSRWELRKDPNRNYPNPCGSEGPLTLKSTSALARFVDQAGIVASATLHTHYPAVVYPWGMRTDDTATEYDPLFIELGRAATVESRYRVGNSAVVIYGADGTFEDYAFGKFGIWSMLFELGSTHNPNPAQVAEMVRANVPGLRRMFERAPTSRAEKHEFRGKCNRFAGRPDRHDE